MKKKYKIMVLRELDYAPVLIAEKKKFFEKNGLEVVLEKVSEYTLKDFQNSQSDGFCISFEDLIMRKAEGIPLEAVFRFSYSKEDLLIADRSIGSLQELSGKTVAFDGLNSSSHFFVNQIIHHRTTLKEEDFYSMNLKRKDVSGALEKKIIQAAHIKKTDLKPADLKKFNVLADSSEIPNILAGVLAFYRNEKESDVSSKSFILRSILQASEFIRKNPEESASLIQEYFPNSENLSEDLKNTRFLNYRENLQSLSSVEKIPNLSSAEPNKAPEIPGAAPKRGTLHLIGTDIIMFYSNRGQFYEEPKVENLISDRYIQETPNETFP